MMERLVIDLLRRFHIRRDRAEEEEEEKFWNRAMFEVFAAYEDELDRQKESLEAATPRESKELKN